MMTFAELKTWLENQFQRPGQRLEYNDERGYMFRWEDGHSYEYQILTRNIHQQTVSHRIDGAEVLRTSSSW